MPYFSKLSTTKNERKEIVLINYNLRNEDEM